MSAAPAPAPAATRNLPLAPGTGDDGWLAAVGVLCADVSAFAPDAIVVSLGVDAAKADPESPLQVTDAATGPPVSCSPGSARRSPVQEGGYDLPTLGASSSPRWKARPPPARFRDRGWSALPAAQNQPR